MQLEDYFDFLAEDDIRIKGSRVGIESVLYDYIYRDMRPEAIAVRFPTINLEQVYATILYYLSQPEKVEAYMLDWLEHSRTMREQQAVSLSPVMLKLRALKQEKQKIEATVR